MDGDGCRSHGGELAASTADEAVPQHHIVC